MRSVSTELAAWLDTHTAGIFRHLVTITTRGGTVVRWTDHHADLTISRPARPNDSETTGTPTFLAGGTGTVPLIRWGYREEYAGTAIGSLDMVLFCGTSAQFDGVRLPLAATRRMLDGAVVKVERVYGDTAPDVSMGAEHIFEGLVMEARPSSIAVELEIECGLAALNIEIPRKQIRPGCQNILFDTQCGLNKATFTVTGTVGGTGGTLVFQSNLTKADGYYNLGVLTFSASTATVALRGVSRAVRTSYLYNGLLELDRPLPTACVPGDAFDVYPGCPKTLEACETKFASDNRARFRGFPYVPREDYASQSELQRYWEPYPTWQWEGLNVRAPDSAYGGVIPIVYGKQRISGTIIWRGLNTSSSPEYANVLVALCEGPITSIPRYWENDTVRDLVVPWYDPTSLLTGTRPTQTPWTTLVSPANLGYPGVAGVGSLTPLANGRVPKYRYEVCAKLYNTGGSDGDADPAQIIQDLFPDSFYGAAFPFSIVTSTGLDGNAASSYARYVAQAEMWLSPIIDSRRPAIDVLGELCKATNAEPLWREGKLWIVPLADGVVGTFSPVTSVRYAFGADDILPSGGDRVRVTIEPETETYNVCPVVFTERSPSGAPYDGTLEYQTATEMDPEPVDVSERGERHAPSVTLPAITRRPHALKLSRILAQRQIRTRQEIEFSTGFRFSRLEPLDLVTVTDELFPYTAQPFQVRKIHEVMETGKITITGQEWIAGVNHATAHVTQSSDGVTSQWPAYNADLRFHAAAAANWRHVYGLTGGYFDGIAWSGSRLCAVGSGNAGAGVCVTSDDGDTFDVRTIPAGFWRAILWTGSAFVAVGDNIAATSSDGATWTSRTIPTGLYYAIANSGSVIVAAGKTAAGNPCVATSVNGGVSWTAQTVSPSLQFRALTWIGGLFVGVGTDTGGLPGTVAATSPDGVTWSSRSIPSGVYLTLVYTGAAFVAGGAYLCAISVDGINWSSRTFPLGAGALGWSGGVLVALTNTYGVSGSVLTSTDHGETWAASPMAAPYVTFTDVVWVGNRFFACSPYGGGAPGGVYVSGTAGPG